MSDYIYKKSKQETTKFLNVVYTVSTSLTLIICILAMIFTEGLVKLFAPSFAPEVFILTVKMTRIILPSIVITVLVTLNSAKLQNHGNFLIPAAVGFPTNIALIFTMLFLTNTFDIEGLSVAIVVGVLLQVALQYPFTHKLGYRFRVDFDFHEEGLRRIGILIIPTVVGSGIQQINTLVDRILASGLAEGSIAALNFSNRLNLFIIGLLSAAIGSVYYTSMSNYYSAGKDKDFRNLLKNSINILILIVIPASMGFFVLRLPIVKFIFERGLFDSRASQMTAIALQYFSIGLISFSLRDVLSRAFYSLKDTKTPMINGSIAVIINIILCITLVKYLDLGGLALATSISGIIGTILLMISLYRRIGDYGLKNISITFIKSLLASAVMGVAVYYCYIFVYGMSASTMLALFAGIVFGVSVYGILILLFKIDEVEALKNILIKRLKS